MKHITWICLLATASLVAPTPAQCVPEGHTSSTPDVRPAALAFPLPDLTLPALPGGEHGGSRVQDGSGLTVHGSWSDALDLSADWASQSPAATAAVQQLPAAAAIVEATIDKEGVSAARRKMEDIEAHAGQYSLNERDINALGYRYLAREAFAEAIAVFEFNVRRFPASDNVYDSLAEACIKANDMARAEATLRAWLAKSPQATTTPARVARFRNLAARVQDESRQAYRAGQPTGLQGPYFGQKPPGITPELFAPGIVSRAWTGDYACTWSPDGKEFYFTRATATPDGGMMQVTMASRLVAGGWTFPEPARFSAGFSAHEPHISRDNKRIYWGWFRPIPAGEPNVQKMNYGIWASERTAAVWSQPTFVGQGMFVSSTNDGQIYVTDHTDLPNGYLAKARMVNGKFAGFERLAGGIEKLRSKTVTNIAHPAIAPDGSFIVFDIEGGSHLFVCFRQADGSWGDAIDLARHGIDPMAGIAYVSPDGKYLFFGVGGDLYWVSTQLIENLRSASR